MVVATGVITLDLRGVYGGLGICLRQAAFQVSSVLTTTGYATADFDLWPGLSRAILFALLFIGGCAGSTAGGLKVSRAMILLRTIRREINRLVHPRRVTAVRCDGKALGSEVQRGVSIYFALYCLCILVAFLCLSGEPFTLETNLSAVVSCFNNVGPGLGAGGSRRKLCGLFRPVKAAAVHGHAHGPVGDLSHAGGAVPLRLAQGLRRKKLWCSSHRVFCACVHGSAPFLPGLDGRRTA